MSFTYPLICIFLILLSCNRITEKKQKQKPFEPRISLDFDRSYGGFSVRLNDESEGYRILTFSGEDSLEVYQYLKLTVSIDSTSTLGSELEIFNLLWEAAMDSIEIDLKSAMVGYPMMYDDILKNQIEAFAQDSSWHDVADNSVEFDYLKLRSVMMDRNVYAPFKGWLHEKEYNISSLSTEKHGFVQEADLLRLGYSGSEKIPLPFMVWFELEKAY